ncbi:MAG: hypothetical protein B7Y41_11695 [Hydrogenophilales bacterium 28-61-23]|nr:MAG: hypothetical protein B7Y41_11695 [Hydrogenophilales bacterium 28-61-23]
MKFLALVLAGLFATLPAHADLSMTGRSTVIAMGMQGIGQEGLWLRGAQLRRDLIDRGKAYSHLYDLNKREITVVDHSQRLAQVYTMSALNTQADTKLASKDLKLNLTPTGRRHMLQKWTCAEYDLVAAMPAEVGGEKVSFTLAGTVWLARDVPEQRETAAIVSAAQTPDFFMGIPALAKSSPAQARGMSEIVRRMAPMGLLCAAEVKTKYEGSGRMATLSNKLDSRISLSYEQYGSTPLNADAFDIPNGYRVTRQ